LRRLAARGRISEKDNNPTGQGHPARPPGGRFQKSTFAQSLSLIEVWAIKTPAGCDIAQSSQITHAQIPLHPGALPAARELNHNGQSDKE